MKRATVYFEEDLHKALKMKSAEISSSVSDLVNDAVRSALFEDAEDLEVMCPEKTGHAILLERGSTNEKATLHRRV